MHDFPETTCKHIYLINLELEINDFTFDNNEIQSVEWIEWELIQGIDVGFFRNDRVYKLLLDYINWKFNNANFVYTLN